MEPLKTYDIVLNGKTYTLPHWHILDSQKKIDEYLEDVVRAEKIIKRNYEYMDKLYNKPYNDRYRQNRQPLFLD